MAQLIEPSRVLCFAAKWHGEPKVLFFSEFHDGKDAMVAAAHELMTQADALCHFNGTSFDVPHLHREFVLAGLTPPAPHKEIDLYLTVKKRFKFVSNKLAHVAKELDLGAKVSHEGHSLWTKCLNGDAAAWARMRKYCIGDVRLTEKLYDRLLPWIASHPHPGLYDPEQAEGCSRCGGVLERRGFSTTAAGRYQRFTCTSCAAWSRGTKNLAKVSTRAV